MRMSEYYMPSNSPVRESISGRASGLDVHRTSAALPAIWAGFLTLVVAGPWLSGGYIFGTDWPGPRRFDFPTHLSSSALLQAALAAVSRVASGELAGKLFVLGLLFVAALMAYRAAPTDRFVPKAVASTVYLVNPFVFGRLHYGQMFLLAGYALLPWGALLLRRLLGNPSLASSVVAALSLALVGVVSAHMFLVASVLAGALLFTHAAAEASQPEYLRRLAINVFVAAVVTLVASAYWVIPLVTGHGQEAATIADIGSADLRAFAAVPDQHLGLLPNLLGLYGFWAENAGRFNSMKDFVSLWPVALAVLLTVSAVGAIAAFRHRPDQLAPWVAGLLVAAVIALILEMGVSHPLTTGVVTWLDTHFSLYRGMRDAGKWAALLALVYSQLAALGAAVTLDYIRARQRDSASREWLVAVATGLLLAFPLYYGNGLLFGMHGEIQPSQYPTGWYAADRALLADSHPGRTLFLPWHEYMTLSFVRNQNRVVAPPAPTFFSTPVLVSTNPELPGAAPPSDPDQVAISELVKVGDQGRWAEVLAPRNIKYVLLAREVDWKSYEYLNHQPGLALVGDYGSIVLYRNDLAP